LEKASPSRSRAALAAAECHPKPLSCDEQIRLILAQDAEIAYQKALQIGKGEEEIYENAEGELVRWDFIGVISLSRIEGDVIEDGIEIASHLFDHDHPESLIPPKDQLDVFY
jgi:hypothetical protein